MLLLAAGAAAADDWVAVKLRGSVFMYVGDEWVRLARGDVVSDQQVVRTQPTGHVTFQRDAETVDVGPNTQIQIIDRTGSRYTTVKQWYGSVEIEAEVQNVQHFAVQTPYLAAIVKGTNFIVSSDEDSSNVRVKRGRVEVDSRISGDKVVITAGQSAESAPGSGDLSVTGKGTGALSAPNGRGNSPANAAVFGPRGGGAAVPGSVGNGDDDGVLDLTVDGPGLDIDLGLGSNGHLIDGDVDLFGTGASASVGGDLSSGLDAGLDLYAAGNDLAGVAVGTGGLGGGNDPLTLGLDTPVGGIHLSLPGL